MLNRCARARFAAKSSPCRGLVQVVFHLEQIADILMMPDELYALRRILLIHSVPRVQDG